MNYIKKSIRNFDGNSYKESLLNNCSDCVPNTSFDFFISFGILSEVLAEISQIILEDFLKESFNRFLLKSQHYFMKESLEKSAGDTSEDSKKNVTKKKKLEGFLHTYIFEKISERILKEILAIHLEEFLKKSLEEFLE